MSKLPVLEARTSPTSVDTEIVAVFQDARKKPVSPRGPYSKTLERFSKGDAFNGRAGATQYVRFGGKGSSESVLFVGMGQGSELTEEKARIAGGSTWSKIIAEKVKIAAVNVDAFWEARGIKPEITHARLIRAFAEGMILGAYEFSKYKAKKDDKYDGPSKLAFVTKDKSFKTSLTNELAQVQALGEAANITRDWSNEPSNFGTPEYYANESKRLAKEYGLTCKILTEHDCEKEKMGLFIGVGQGAEREGRIVVLEYTPKGVKNPKTIALVGKGVTFDSGGISIKPSARMEEMKHDMTGAATIMGATLLAAKWQVPNKIIAILAFTENMPDGSAIQPGNVLTSRAGKTVEVINTDAEGRLILADALDYAQDFKPDAIIDAATLTGAVSIALGKMCCAILGNDEQLIEAVRNAGAVNSERIWQLPLYDEYFDDLKSDYADMKNSANDSYGGTIRGAAFLKQFIKGSTKWAHLDIAATAYHMSHLSYYPKRGASGAYVRTLAQFAADF